MLNEKIIYYRKKNGLSQEELAGKLLVSRQTVSQWETGQTSPTVDNLIRLKEIFGVSVDALLSDDGTATADAGAADAPFIANSADAAEAAEAPSYGGDRAESERFRFVPTWDELQRFLSGGTGTLIVFVLFLLIFLPLAWFSGSDVPEQASGYVLCMLPLASFMLAAVVLLRRRQKKQQIENFSGTEIEVCAHADSFTETVFKKGKTAKFFRVQYADITQVDDLGSFFRARTRDYVMFLLPKLAMDPTGALYGALTVKAKETADKRYANYALRFIPAAVLAVFVVIRFSNVAAADGATTYLFIPLLLIANLTVLPLIVLGIVWTAKKRRHGVLLIVTGVVLFACILNGFFFISKTSAEKRREIQEDFLQEVETELGIEIPDGEIWLDVSFALPKRGDSRSLNDLFVSIPENEIASFSKKAADDPNWINGKEVLRLAPIWNRTIDAAYVADDAAYVMVYNITDQTYNTLPYADGTYTMLNLILFDDLKDVRIIKYEIDYHSETQITSVQQKTAA